MRARPASPADVIADALARQSLDGVVDDLDLLREPVAVIRQTLPAAPCGRRSPRRAHRRAAPGSRHPRSSCIRCASPRAIACMQLLVALVIFVLAVGDDACRRGHRQKRLLHLDALQRGLEVVDVPLQLGLAGIGDRARRRPNSMMVATLRARRARRRTRQTASRSAPRVNGLAASALNGRRSKPPSRASAIAPS